MLSAMKKWAASLKVNLLALYYASRHPGAPVIAKIIIVFVVAYALSPIDLIPDFMPVIGYLDDLILLPAGIWIAMRLIPAGVWEECHTLAKDNVIDLPVNRCAGAVILFIWLAVILALSIAAWYYLTIDYSTSP